MSGFSRWPCAYQGGWRRERREGKKEGREREGESESIRQGGGHLWHRMTRGPLSGSRNLLCSFYEDFQIPLSREEKDALTTRVRRLRARVLVSIYLACLISIRARDKGDEGHHTRSQPKAKQSKARQVRARQDKTRQDKVMQDKIRQGKARQDKTRQDKTRGHKQRQDKTR